MDGAPLGFKECDQRLIGLPQIEFSRNRRGKGKWNAWVGVPRLARRPFTSFGSLLWSSWDETQPYEVPAATMQHHKLNTEILL